MVQCQEKIQNIAGIILCGGRSSRMGQSKAMLDIAGEPALARMVRILNQVVSPIIIVAAPHQELPALYNDVIVTRDEQEYLGPLAGIAAGLAALPSAIEAAYITGCDTPLLRPAFIRCVISQLGTDDIAVPRFGSYYHPLAAVYRTGLAQAARELVQRGLLRPLYLLESAHTHIISEESLREVDPDLESLRNMNTQEDYAEVLQRLQQK